MSEEDSSGEIRLRFKRDLILDIINHEKDTTWRVEYGVDVSPGDTLELYYLPGDPFGLAKVKSVKKVKLKDISDEDREGHKTYGNVMDRIEGLKQYYDDTTITPETIVTVIKFNLIATQPHIIEDLL